MDTSVVYTEKQALIAIRKLRRQVEQLEYRQREPIAIVGLSCRFPLAPDADAFWRLLDDGIDATREIPRERWDIDAYYDPAPDTPGKIYTRRAGCVDGIDMFDAAFFGISPREAQYMDPQQRLLLEQAWCALEDAGIAAADIDGIRGGVFVGLSANDYGMMIMDAGIDLGPHYVTGNCLNAAAGRLAYVLRLHGPALVVDTACSSSLVAVHQACTSLRTGESDLALAGGVNLLISPKSTIATCRARMLSVDGRCKTFDASADGFARGEGCGLVVLKRLSDAQRDGDRIRAVIRGNALNHDGRSSGLTVPNGPAQQQVIADALRMAELSGSDVQYLETHGTGTPLGDPIELQAAAAVLAGDRARKAPLLVGAVKTNIGHLEAASGIASLIKVVLAIEHGRIPRHLHFSRPSPHIPWNELNVRVTAEPEPWLAGEAPRIAGVSALGFSGTNAHVVIEEPPAAELHTTIASSPISTLHLLVLSGRTAGALTQLAVDYRGWLERNKEVNLSDLCYTANTGRNHFEQRSAMVFGSAAQLCDQLTALSGSRKAQGLLVKEVKPDKAKRRIAFLFSGQGGQYTGMGRELYETQPVYREQFDRCAAEFARLRRGQPGLRDIVFEQEHTTLLTETGYIQPAVYALQVSLAALWRSWGVVPHAVAGHSAGEYAAACVSGVFTVEEGMRLIVERARLMQTLPAGGAMLTVTASAEAADAAIAGDDSVSVSAYHGLNTILSGPSERLDALMAQFEKQQLYCSKLPASHAFHSRFVEPILDAFEAYARTIQYAAPARRFVSTLTGSTVSVVDAAHWRSHARRPVRFADAVRTLLEDIGCDVMLELGPHAELMWLAQMCWRPDHEVLWTSSLARGRNALEHMLTAAAQLHTNGTVIDFRGMEGASVNLRKKLSLPTYPFQRQRYWFEKAPGSPRRTRGIGHLLYELSWQVSRPRTEDATRFEHRTWLILGAATGIGRLLVHRLKAMGSRALLAELPQDAAAIPECLAASLEEATADADYPLQGILHLWAVEDRQPDDLLHLQQAQERGVLSALALAQRLIGDEIRTELWLVTHGVHAIVDGDRVDATHAPLWGLGKSIRLVHPEILRGMLDLPFGPCSETVAEQLFQTLKANDSEDHIALRQGQRWVARLKPAAGAIDVTRINLDARGSYLITGGLGAIGLHIAKRFAERGARRFVLTGRSRPGVMAMEGIRALEEQGCEVKTFQLDVSQEKDVRLLFDELENSKIRLAGIVHAAGSLKIAPLADLSRDQFVGVMAPKVWGAWLLDRESKSRQPGISLFVCASSMASVWGAPSNAHYASANMYLDALMSGRQAEGLAGLSVNFGPWKGPGIVPDEQAQKLHRQLGLRELEPALALDALETLMCSHAGQACVADVDWSTFKPLAEFHGGERTLFTEVGPAVTPSIESFSASANESLEALRAADEPRRVQLLVSIIRNEVAHVLKIEPASLDEDASLLELGMDSMMAVELIHRLGRALPGTAFSPALLQGYPSTSQLGRAMARRVITQDQGKGDAGAGRTNRSCSDRSRHTTADEPQQSGESHYRIKDGPRYTFRHHRAGDRTAVIESFETAFGKGPARALERFFDWKYLENPFGPAHGKFLYVLECEGKIVGMNGGSCARFKIGDTTAPGIWSCDSHVVPEHRKVTNWFFQQVNKNTAPVHLGMPNVEMYRFAQAMGAVTHLDRLVELKVPLDVQALLDSRGHGVIVSRIAGLLFRPALKVFGLLSGTRTANDVAVTKVAQFDSRFDALWDAVAPGYPGIMVRDLAFLSYRFDRCPRRDYTRYVAERDGDIVGYMVTREQRLRGCGRGRIVDFLVRDGRVLDSLTRRVMEDFAARGMVSVTCPISSSQTEIIRLLRWHGFLLHKHFAHVVASRGPLVDSMAAVPNWFFTLADADNDYNEDEECESAT